MSLPPPNVTVLDHSASPCPDEAISARLMAAIDFAQSRETVLISIESMVKYIRDTKFATYDDNMRSIARIALDAVRAHRFAFAEACDVKRLDTKEGRADFEQSMRDMAAMFCSIGPHPHALGVEMMMRQQLEDRLERDRHVIEADEHLKRVQRAKHGGEAVDAD